MKTITHKVVVNPNEKLVWAEDMVIELAHNYLTIKGDFIKEKPKDEDDLTLGLEECKVCYERTILKSQIVAVEWQFDKDKMFSFWIETNNDRSGYNCKSKKESIERYEEIKTWLLS